MTHKNPSCPNALLLPCITADSDLAEIEKALAPIESVLRQGKAPIFDSGSFTKVQGPKLDRPSRPRIQAVIRRS
jgi:hypothetical protein